MHTRKIKKITWLPLIVHFMLGLIFAWIMQTSPLFAGLFGPIVDLFVAWIPSILGYATLSSDPEFAKAFLTVCWIGAPYHIFLLGRMMWPIYAIWVRQQRTFRFWMIALTCFAGALAMLFLPSVQHQPTDASESVRTAALLTTLMKNNFTVFLIMAFGTTYTSAFLLTASVITSYLKLFGATNSNPREIQ